MVRALEDLLQPGVMRYVREPSSGRMQLRSDLDLRHGDRRLLRYTHCPNAPHFSEKSCTKAYRYWVVSIPEESVDLFAHPALPIDRFTGTAAATATRRPPAAMHPLTNIVQHCDPRSTWRWAMSRGRFPPTRITSMAEHQPSIAFAVQESDAAVTTAFLSSTGRISRRRDRFANAHARDDEFAANDITRASLDGESFDPAVQQAVNCVQSFEEAAATTERRRVCVA
jgi:oxygen-independent coproporphyrinogen-3 oxidase